MGTGIHVRCKSSPVLDIKGYCQKVRHMSLVHICVGSNPATLDIIRTGRNSGMGSKENKDG